MSDITALSALELSEAIRRGQISPSEVMAATLERIDRLNPDYNAIVSLRDHDALMAEARASEDAPRRGWLHGIPFAVKDLEETMGLRTTHGSPLYADFIPDADSEMVARIRAAGAIFIGKTNTPEWGYGSHSFNKVHGATGGAYDKTRSAGGSSGGAAAGVALRMLAVADGSDMMGSLRNPAAYNNIYGFRPSWGVVAPDESKGCTFIDTLSTCGPMGRTIDDIYMLLRTQMRQPISDLFGDAEVGTDLPQNRDPAGKRIAWLGDWGGAMPFEPGILDLCQQALMVFADTGCVVEAVTPTHPLGGIWSSWTTLRSFSIHAKRVNDISSDAARAVTRSAVLWEMDRGRDMSGEDIRCALEERAAWQGAATRLFEDYDALVLPSAQVFPFPIENEYPTRINGVAMDTYHRWMEVVVPASLLGLPVLNVPAGFDASGLPMGLQIIGPYGRDRDVLELGQFYHHATDWPGRRPPDPNR